MGMNHVRDRVGQRFGRLTVTALARIHRYPNGKTTAVWSCRCDCGGQLDVLARSLISGHTVSCGCAVTDMLVARNSTHRASGTPTYMAWGRMLSRCSNPKAAHYEYYGGRGISVCERWRSFENFLADMGELPDRHSIDRIDPNGHYEPGNCRWLLMRHQARNTRRSHMLEHNGRRQCVSAWAEEYGLPQIALLKRLRRGWDLERALTTPLRLRPRPTEVRPSS